MLAGGRRWAWRTAGIGVLVGGGVSALALLIVRRAVIGTSSPAADAIYDAVTGPLRIALWAVAAAGLMVTLLAFVLRRALSISADQTRTRTAMTPSRAGNAHWPPLPEASTDV